MVLFVSIISTRQHCRSSPCQITWMLPICTLFFPLFLSFIAYFSYFRMTNFKLLITWLLTCSRSMTDTNNCLSEFIANLCICLRHGIDPNTKHSRETCQRLCSKRWWLSPNGELMECTWPTASGSNHLKSRQSSKGAFTQFPMHMVAACWLPKVVK